MEIFMCNISVKMSFKNLLHLIYSQYFNPITALSIFRPSLESTKNGHTCTILLCNSKIKVLWIFLKCSDSFQLEFIKRAKFLNCKIKLIFSTQLKA